MQQESLKHWWPTNYKAQHPRRQPSSYSLPWEPEISPSPICFENDKRWKQSEIQLRINYIHFAKILNWARHSDVWGNGYKLHAFWISALRWSERLALSSDCFVRQKTAKADSSGQQSACSSGDKNCTLREIELQSCSQVLPTPNEPSPFFPVEIVHTFNYSKH
jgi:hypothetical protein